MYYQMSVHRYKINMCVCAWMRHTDYLKSKRQPMNRICGLNGETTNGCTHHTHTRTQTPRQNVFNANWTACGKCSRFINVIDCLSNCRINLMCGHGFYFGMHTLCALVFLEFRFLCKNLSSWLVNTHQWDEEKRQKRRWSGVRINRKMSPFSQYIFCKLTIQM